jgi:hypothetical protein
MVESRNPAKTHLVIFSEIAAQTANMSARPVPRKKI